jgi:addiction module HigA family antidote
MRKKLELLPPIHPGEILREEYMGPLGLSINKLARDLYVPVTRISEILNERRGVTADTALRLGRYFGTTAEFWINLQKKFELETAARNAGEEIARQVRPATPPDAFKR